MKLMINILSLITFFVLYKLNGIYIATIGLLIISCMQIVFARFKIIAYSKKQILFFHIVLFLCAATLIFKNELFIKFKPTIIYWSCGLYLLGNRFLKGLVLIKQIASDRFILSEKVWDKVNTCWIIFFVLIGGVNLYVVYNYDTEAWVYFKIFGILGTTILFVLSQIIIYLIFKVINRNPC